MPASSMSAQANSLLLHPGKRWSDASFTLLSFATGATDAYAFLAFGGIFTANMTGNAILAGLFSRSDYGHVLSGAATAIASFGIALYAGFRLTRKSQGWPAGERDRALGALLAAFVMQLLTACAWALWRQRTSPLEELGMIGISSCAMALQTVAAKRAGADRSISTTYITGTISGFMQDLAEGVTGERIGRVIIVAALWIGAIAGTAVMAASPASGPLLPAAILAVIILRQAWTSRLTDIIHADSSLRRHGDDAASRFAQRSPPHTSV